MLWGVLALAVLLLFWSLGGRYLWQDEAETALLAKSILKSGLPIASDGTNVVSQETGREFDADFLWRLSPWMQFYIASASIGLLGPTPLAARLPFALLGFLSLPTVYVLSRKLFDSVDVARLSALYMALSVPFLLHARQARWHSPAYLLLVILLISVLSLARGEHLSLVVLVVSGSLLFYTNYFIAIGALLALLIAAPLLEQGSRFVKNLLIAFLAIGILTLPGMIFFRVFAKGGGINVARAVTQLWGYVGSYLTFLIPLPMLGLICYLLVEKSRFGLREEWKRRVWFLLSFSLVYIVYLSLAPWAMFRYLSILIPVQAVLLGAGTSWIMRQSRLAGVSVLMVIAFTNALHLTPLAFLKTPGTRSADRFPSVGPVSFPFFGYLYELTHTFDDPEKVLCHYLKAHAGPKDVVLITYGDLPLQFCLGLRVVGGLQGQRPPMSPDWIILRQFAISTDPGKDYDVLRFIYTQINPNPYKRVSLPSRDSMLGNNPDPTFHLFRMPGNAPPLTLLRRQRDQDQ